MKTEKQIFLLSKEMGEQRIKETEPVDEIIVEKENYNTWAEKLKNRMKYRRMVITSFFFYKKTCIKFAHRFMLELDTT